ncbi:hypothetical protein ACJX0J_023679, partial [Zea mays]
SYQGLLGSADLLSRQEDVHHNYKQQGRIGAAFGQEEILHLIYFVHLQEDIGPLYCKEYTTSHIHSPTSNLQQHKHKARTVLRFLANGFVYEGAMNDTRFCCHLFLKLVENVLEKGF